MENYKKVTVSDKKINKVEPSSAMLCNIWSDLGAALLVMPAWERGIHIFWLLGPFILLIERSPADIWLTFLVLAFLLRSILTRDGSWLSVLWVRACFVFLACSLFSSAMSVMPYYALSETLVWFRFPMFAMATAFWLGTDKRLLYAMLISTALGMLLMTGIVAAEMFMEGQKEGRLSWPYGDLVTGNYLAKVGLPAFTIMVALAIGAKPKLASVMGVLSLINIIASIFTGERINLILRACAGMLAALAWRPYWSRFFILVAIEVSAVFGVFLASPSIQTRFFDNFIKQLPFNAHSDYFAVMASGIEASKNDIFFGLGPATYRELCPSLVKGIYINACDNHPHNFYIQLLTETGVIGLIAGSLMIASIIWAAFAGWRKNRANVVAATAFVVPFGLFFPVQSTADFFGQWNNIFMWSAIALALAAARALTSDEKK